VSVGRLNRGPATRRLLGRHDLGDAAAQRWSTMVVSRTSLHIRRSASSPAGAGPRWGEKFAAEDAQGCELDPKTAVTAAGRPGRLGSVSRLE
jgi:hypothetical protein